MPKFDKTGPCGYGPMTGRGMGYCNDGMAGGYGYGRRGFGCRVMTRKREIEMLNEEKENLKEELEAIKERLEEIEKEEK